jgi:hypothetical protein
MPPDFGECGPPHPSNSKFREKMSARLIFLGKRKAKEESKSASELLGKKSKASHGGRISGSRNDRSRVYGDLCIFDVIRNFISLDQTS